MTSERQANSKESRERHAELLESAGETGRAEGYQRMATK